MWPLAVFTGFRMRKCMGVSPGQKSSINELTVRQGSTVFREYWTGNGAVSLVDINIDP